MLCANDLSCLCSLVFTVEQFQEHQEQLALMQKQQLEQIQQQASDVSNNAQVCMCEREKGSKRLMLGRHLHLFFMP